MQASMKPPSPLRAPEQQPLKPTTPVCPKRSPTFPQELVVSVFTQWVCTLASNRDLTAATWGNDVIRTPTRRRHAGSQLLMLQNPHRRRCGGCRGTAKYGGGAGSRWRGRGSVVPGTVPGRIAGPGTVAEPGPLVVAGRQARQNSPSTAPPPTQPATKFAQHATNSQFWAIFRALGELFRARVHHQTEQGENCHPQGTETRAS